MSNRDHLMSSFSNLHCEEITPLAILNSSSNVREKMTYDKELPPPLYRRSFGLGSVVTCCSILFCWILLAIIPLELLDYFVIRHTNFWVYGHVLRFFIYSIFAVCCLIHCYIVSENIPSDHDSEFAGPRELRNIMQKVNSASPLVSIETFDEMEVKTKELMGSSSDTHAPNYRIQRDTEIVNFHSDVVPFVTSQDISNADERLETFIQINDYLSLDEKTYFWTNLFRSPILKLKIKTYVYPIDEQTSKRIELAKLFFCKKHNASNCKVSFHNGLAQSEYLVLLEPISPFTNFLFSKVSFFFSLFCCTTLCLYLMKKRLYTVHEYESHKVIQINKEYEHSV